LRITAIAEEICPGVHLMLCRRLKRENPRPVTGVRRSNSVDFFWEAFIMKLVNSAITLTTLSLAVVFGTNAALAQRDAGSKIRGEYSFYGGATGSALRSAQEYSANYQQYAKTAQTVNPEIARESADTIGTYITKAQRHLAWMRTQAQASNDKETLTALDSIDKHLGVAAKSHREMFDTCLKDSIEAGTTMDCCKHIDEHLAAAIAEHDKLMKRVAAKK
jgi:hypothetical protein